MMSQKEAVFNAFSEAVSSIEGVATVSDLSTEQLAAVRAQVKEAVSNGLHDGTIEWGSADKSPAACLKYAGALISNYFKKDERLSGSKYTPTQARGPQTRDEVLRKLTEVRKSAAVHQPAMLEAIDAKIAARRAELAAAKSATKSASKVKPLGEAIAALEELGIQL